ncbi:MAG TPA: indolepyruvate oxidoreductase subunit beta [bacterium]|nr:indolepyruvate oxidoreductase subunit beta [bacterium]
MKYDVILCGVGGQGILSVAAVIARAAMDAGLQVRQSEVHGMAQRGGAVQAHLRLSDGDIHGDLIGLGRADMILSMEPLESLRYVAYLSANGMIVSAAEAYNNIVDYPDIAAVLTALKAQPRSIIVHTKSIAEEAGNPNSANMALVGAAAAYLPLDITLIQNAVSAWLSSKGGDIVDRNLKALDLGRKAGVA